MSPTHSWARGKKYRYYVCSNKQKRGSAACPCPSLPASEIESFVLEQVRIAGWVAENMAAQAQGLRQVLKRIDCDGKRFALAFLSGSQE